MAIKARNIKHPTPQVGQKWCDIADSVERDTMRAYNGQPVLTLDQMLIEHGI